MVISCWTSAVRYAWWAHVSLHNLHTDRLQTRRSYPKAQSADKRTTDGKFYFSFALFSCEPFFSVSHFDVSVASQTHKRLYSCSTIVYRTSSIATCTRTGTHGQSANERQFIVKNAETHMVWDETVDDVCVCVAIFDSQITFVRRMCVRSWCNSIWLKSKWNCTKMAYRCRCRPEQP